MTSNSEDRLPQTARLAFTIDEICALSSLGRTSVFLAIKAGELVARKHGRRTMVLAEDLRNFLQAMPTTKVGVER